ncbi:MAG: hypothetical protein B6D41_09350 [Chloroflexi bacterium UTCFX4]|jgi:uncharacterized membrane protein YraQ (UPF0718 family)|nr:MAG: hypothetical protein B6D41_09350 [Chloroflexi bacterium UTCFX4]
MSENIFSALRDLIVLAYLFTLRIGAPIIATLFIGWWLERKLTEWDAREAEALEQQRAIEQERQALHRPMNLK